jgi:transcription antitermination factor NusG
VVAALPGFLFIKEGHWEKALDEVKRRGMGGFSRLMFAGIERSVSEDELRQFAAALNDSKFDVAEIGDLSVGDEVIVKFGPMAGLHGELVEIYVKNCLMAKLSVDDEMRKGARSVVALPVSFLTK